MFIFIVFAILKYAVVLIYICHTSMFMSSILLNKVVQIQYKQPVDNLITNKLCTFAVRVSKKLYTELLRLED